MILINPSVKINPVGFPENTKEGKDKKLGDWTRAKMLEMMAWILIPAIYLIFKTLFRLPW